MDSAALQQFVEDQILEQYPALYRLAFTYVKNPDDAMDVVQESVYKAMRGCAQVQNREAVRSWLCRIVVNTALDLLRGRSREVLTDILPESGREDVYADPDLLRALDVLEERERTVVVLRFFQELKLHEIAKVTGENLNTVKTILYRSLKKLKAYLTEGEDERERTRYEGL